MIGKETLKNLFQNTTILGKNFLLINGIRREYVAWTKNTTLNKEINFLKTTDLEKNADYGRTLSLGFMFICNIIIGNVIK